MPGLFQQACSDLHICLENNILVEDREPGMRVVRAAGRIAVLMGLERFSNAKRGGNTDRNTTGLKQARSLEHGRAVPC